MLISTSRLLETSPALSTLSRSPSYLIPCYGSDVEHGILHVQVHPSHYTCIWLCRCCTGARRVSRNRMRIIDLTQIASSSLTCKIGIVSRRANRHRFRRSSEEIAEVVCQVLKSVGRVLEWRLDWATAEDLVKDDVVAALSLNPHDEKAAQMLTSLSPG